MKIQIEGANENNLQNIDVEFEDGLTVVTGISGSGKSSLVFSTLYHEARRRFSEIFTRGSRPRLAPAKVHRISGLGPTIAIEQNILNRNPLSSLASASGLHPFLRIFYIHYGQRHCVECNSEFRIYSEDEIVDLLSQLLKEGSVDLFAPLVKAVKGSHRSLLQSLVKELGREALLVDGKWYQDEELEPQERHDIEIKINTINKPLSTIEIREYTQNIRALGANAVKIKFDTPQNYLTLPFTNICPNCNHWIREIKATIFNISCPFCKRKGCEHCQGTGLHPEALSITWKGNTLPDLLKLSVTEATTLFKDLDLPSSADRLVFEIKRRLRALITVGLGYITLDRSSPTLSRGESQRVRLAVALVSRLEDMIHVLDEPTIGLSITDVTKLLPAFQQLKGPVIFVEHDRIAAASADQAIDLGPEAGIKGGKLVFSGPLPSLWETEGYTGRFFSHQERVKIPKQRSSPTQFLEIIEASQHNLQRISTLIPIGRLTVITGPSGSGKSSFVEEVLYASLKKGKPTGCKEVRGMKLKPILVDQSPIGKNPRSNPATYTDLAAVIRDIFAKATNLSSSHFSFNREEGWCRTCKGMGAIEVKMRFLPSTWIRCEACEGKRFSDDVLLSKIKDQNHSFSIADIYELSVDEAYEWFIKGTIGVLTSKDRTTAKRILEALRDVGLGYLPLGQSSPSLSGGEAQRVKLAKYLGKKTLKSQLIILDEPSTGLHPHDISSLLNVLDKLVRARATIVVVEHNSDFIRAADWIIDLGPGAGLEGGQLIYNGIYQELLNRSESLTTQGLLYEESLVPKIEKSLPEKKSDTITIDNAFANNLKNITIELPKNALTVVTGVSGSGKSSLISDVLKAEAERRYLETLSLYERQGLREGPEAPVNSISGLGVTISIDPRRISRWFNYRSTVGLITEISHHLTILISNFGQYQCPDCSISCERTLMEWSCPKCNNSHQIPEPKFFSPSNYASACLTCQGIGTLQIPKPEKLIIHPEKPLCKGAMYSPGFFPKGYICKRYNGGYYVLQALAKRFHFDPTSTPWHDMSNEAQEGFLFGVKEPLEVTFESRSKKIGDYTRTIDFKGFYGWIGDWDVGGTYSSSEVCPACNGTRFRPEYLKITLSTYNIHELNEMPFNQLLNVLKDISFPDIQTHVAQYSLNTILHRLEFLDQVGLGYINASRIVMTLSAGEAQRIRLAGLLGSNLTSLTVLADEPTRGLHPSEIDGLLKALDSLRKSNTVIIVEHDPQVITAADHVIDIGPGPGEAGGEIVAQGSVTEVSNSTTVTGLWLGGKRRFKRPKKYNLIRKPKGWLKLHGANQNNLKGDPLEIPLGTLTGVCGVSGSGKSTLMIDTLGRILAPKKQTTSVAYEPIEPGKYDSIEGAPSRTIIIDQSKHEISNPLTYLNLKKPLISLYNESDDAKASELDEKELYQQCKTCKGRGTTRMDMGFLPDVFIRCDICQGTGLTAEAWMVRLHEYTYPELYDLTLDQVYELFNYDERISRPLKAVKGVGLGYLALRQPRIHLSGGECQRLKIANEFCRKKAKTSTLYILDEPTVGLHLQDVSQLLKILHRLVDEGNTVVVIEHHPHVLAACDWIIEIGPVGGPEGGFIIANGTPIEVAKGDTPTAQYLKPLMEGQI